MGRPDVMVVAVRFAAEKNAARTQKPTNKTTVSLYFAPWQLTLPCYGCLLLDYRSCYSSIISQYLYVFVLA